MPNKNDIYQMDCSAVVYPYIATKDVNQSFTMEADLDTDIDPVRLKAAAQSLCERFPTMFVKLHTDSKGYALEHVHDVTPFVIFLKTTITLSALHTKRTELPLRCSTRYPTEAAESLCLSRSLLSITVQWVRRFRLRTEFFSKRIL